MNELRLKQVVKSFGASTVLRGITLDFKQGTVTAIVGDNGAGKSTLCKTITGVHRLDSGTISLGDLKLDHLSPHDIRAAGVEMIYQDLALAVQQDVVTNLFLGREITVGWPGWLKREEMRKAGEAMLSEMGIHLPNLKMAVGQLSGGQQQAVAITRALLFSTQVLIMDEPTAALAAREIEHILELIEKLKARGLIVILISHRLNDVFRVSDRIITLRSGEVAADQLASETSMQQVVSQIVGA